MEQKGNELEVKQMNFTITRTDEKLWFNIKLPGGLDYVLELPTYNILDLAEHFNLVIRSEEDPEHRKSEEDIM